jgi:hypothetical protein
MYFREGKAIYRFNDEGSKLFNISLITRQDEAWVFMKQLWGTGDSDEFGISKNTIWPWHYRQSKIVIKTLFKTRQVN